MNAPELLRFRLSVATDTDRPSIYRLRHDVFARELRQHGENTEEQLVDRLDTANVYILVKNGDDLVGHISVTPPGHHGYSIDKYVGRERLPFPVDDGTYEIRLLTVRHGHRGGSVAGILMLAAYEWILARHGTRIIALGRRELRSFYRKAGLLLVDVEVRSGAVTFDLMTATTERLNEVIRERRRSVVQRMLLTTEWDAADFPLAADPHVVSVRRVMTPSAEGFSTT